jgi:hypothetical protein
MSPESNPPKSPLEIELDALFRAEAEEIEGIRSLDTELTQHLLTSDLQLSSSDIGSGIAAIVARTNPVVARPVVAPPNETFDRDRQRLVRFGGELWRRAEAYVGPHRRYLAPMAVIATLCFVVGVAAGRAGFPPKAAMQPVSVAKEVAADAQQFVNDILGQQRITVFAQASNDTARAKMPRDARRTTHDSRRDMTNPLHEVTRVAKLAVGSAMAFVRESATPYDSRSYAKKHTS